MIALPTLSIPTTKRFTKWHMPTSAAFALNLVHSMKGTARHLVVVTQDTLSAERLAAEISFFGGEATVLPDLEVLPFDPFSPQPDLISRRLGILSNLQNGNIPLLIIAMPVMMQYLCPPNFLSSHVLMLQVGQKFNREKFRSALINSGYVAVSQVMAAGEFAIRGALFDLFPSGSEYPIRIDCFDDEIETLRTFNPETQRTLKEVNLINLLPAREFETTEAGINRFRRKFRESFEGDPAKSSIYTEVSAGRFPAGIESYLPLFFEQSATVFDYIGDLKHTTLVTFPDIAESAATTWTLINRRYESYRYDQTRPLLPPERLYLSPEALNNAILQYPTIQLEWAMNEKEGGNGLNDDQYNNLSNNLSHISIERLPDFLNATKHPVVLVAESAGRREILLEKLKQSWLSPELLPSFEVFLAQAPRFSLVIGVLEKGFSHQKPHFTVLTESELLGIKPKAQRKRAKTTDPDSVISDLESLKENDPIVHLAHGVGRYVGLEVIDETEFVVISYQGNAKLYVPVSSLDRLSRYSGSNSEHAPWHKLGSEAWEKSCKKAAEKVRDAAAELLDIYARREARQAKGLLFDIAEYEQFSNAFPFEETADQNAAILAVKQDLLQGKMDRIVCGDVGFGKTEVAMRAAFITVSGGSQVAMIAPTTLLAEQHAKNFADRFADWPFKIASLSRFRSAKEVKDTLVDLENGKVDIVIGTHKLLSSDIKFKQLGLMIIDEEHRFGVRQKEQLKNLRVDVSVLTMTATPIPRTLNMGLSGLKSLSIMATPPDGRLAVKTFVNEWNEALIVEAVTREFTRGGQVYFLHNDVESIGLMAETLSKLCEGAKIGIAHGQMRERELEQVMLDFYHHRVNLLLCTTIVESGIDVPTANTIIINRADKLGLAQLHQLRGRVGRSSHRAYCYLITPNQKSMTSDALKRIEAITETADLGAGFMLANHDLEIRGAGELLGESQSGQINEIGFGLYMEMLSKAVEAIKNGREIDVDAPFKMGVDIDLGVPAFIPDDYLPDVHMRLTFYKRISSAKHVDHLDELQIEMIDRFGLLPDQIKALFKITQIKLAANPLNLKKIDANKEGVRIVFGDQPTINIQNLIELVQTQPNLYQLQGQDVLKYRLPLEHLELRGNAVLAILAKLT